MPKAPLHGNESHTKPFAIQNTSTGGAMSQHANEYHNPDMALQSDFASHKDRHKSGGADAFASTDLLEAVVKRIQESTPTTLTVGSISDGQVLKRSGTSIIGLTLSGTIKTTLTGSVTGTLSIGDDKTPRVLAPCTLTLVKVKGVVKTAPTGAAIKIQIEKNGVDIFSESPDNRLTINAAAYTGESSTFVSTSVSEDDNFKVNIDQVGSTVAGADLTVEIVCSQAVTFA